MAGLQYYFFPTDFYYPRPPKINGDMNNNNNISTTHDDVAVTTAGRGGTTVDGRDMSLLQDKILKVPKSLSMNLVRYQPVLVSKNKGTNWEGFTSDMRFHHANSDLTGLQYKYEHWAS
ncbi:hypothetical protein FXO38_29007 [Capsicum annuum]|nr:hypothetical protein FXO38_29007 [Capsicum annuum]KAF3628579.1 hypothetical protein FXO37_29329 [Capsicum annuum]